ncbi:MAG: ABC transporter substrate-binding protein, partial [Pseudomonadota bacterium]
LWRVRVSVLMKQFGKRIRAGALAAAGLLVSPAGVVSGPSVASLNVCTDQLAMLLAEPGQLKSVSNLARDPTLSPLHQQARQYPVNKGIAEEVLVMKPDLVVTGTFSLHNTTGLLSRLGFAVEEFGYSPSVETIAADIRRMGRLLDQSTKAEIMASRFERDLAQLGPLACSRKPVALFYGARGVALGKGTLAHSALQAAGFANMAAERGYEGVAVFPLELLVQDPPDLIILPAPTPGAPALADEILSHPVLKRLTRTVTGDLSSPALLSCGGPFTMQAIHELRAFAPSLLPCTEASGS